MNHSERGKVDLYRNLPEETIRDAVRDVLRDSRPAAQDVTAATLAVRLVSIAFAGTDRDRTINLVPCQG